MASRSDRTARWSVTVIFFLTGAVIAAWSTRVPAIQERLHLSPASLAVAIVGIEAGAIVGLPAGGVLVARLGSRWGLRAGFAIYPTALAAAGVAPGLAALTAALAVMAAANSVVDVAMNVQGVELERRYRRPVLSSLHAGHSLGLLAGGLAGTAAAAAGSSVGSHFAVTAAVAVALGLTATGFLVDEHHDIDQPTSRAPLTLFRPDRTLVLLGLVAFCAFLLDGAALHWSAAHLHSTHQAAPGLAAAAFTVFTVTLVLGRIVTDRLTDRLGRVRVVQAAGVIAAAGVVLAVTAPGAAVALAGWAVFGLGVSAIAPTVLGAAAGASRGPVPVAIAAVTTVGYLGSFTGPPLIGVVAGVTGLPVALASLAAIAIIAALLARPAIPQRLVPIRTPEMSPTGLGPAVGRRQS